MARYIEDTSAVELFTIGTLDSLVPETSVVRTIWSALEGLDFGQFDAAYKNDETGRPAVDPRRLVGVWVLALLRDVTSSVRLADLCGRDSEFRWMLGDAKVEKSTLCDFRKVHSAKLAELSSQVLAAMGQSGLLPGESVAIDGTIIRAAASCRSVKRRKDLVRQVERLKRTIEEKLAEPRLGGDGDTVAVLDKRRERMERALGEMQALGLTQDDDRWTMSEPGATVK